MKNQGRTPRRRSSSTSFSRFLMNRRGLRASWSGSHAAVPPTFLLAIALMTETTPKGVTQSTSCVITTRNGIGFLGGTAPASSRVRRRSLAIRVTQGSSISHVTASSGNLPCASNNPV